MKKKLNFAPDTKKLFKLLCIFNLYHFKNEMSYIDYLVSCQCNNG